MNVLNTTRGYKTKCSTGPSDLLSKDWKSNEQSLSSQQGEKNVFSAIHLPASLEDEEPAGKHPRSWGGEEDAWGEGNKSALYREREGCQVSMYLSYISTRYISTRYRHLYKRSGELSSVEISQSIREIFGTAHILDVAPQNSCEGESEISDSQSSNLSNTFEEAVTDENRSGKIFICPLCGQDFSHIGSFSKHNEREHNDKIEQLEMFSYVAAKTGCEDQDS